MKWSGTFVGGVMALAGAVAVAVSAGCASGCKEGCGGGGAESVTHVVLVSLNGPAGRAALERDTREMLSRVPGIVEFSVGVPVETGRGAVDGSYDVGFAARFRDRASYAAYETDPAHVSLKDAWRGRVRELRIFDFGASGPAR